MGAQAIHQHTKDFRPILHELLVFDQSSIKVGPKPIRLELSVHKH
jgi:hypothetical protein